MIKIKFAAIFVYASIIFSACATTSENLKASDVQVAKADVSTKSKAKAKEPEDPPNVKFVKQLQAKLNENDISGAILLFDQIPQELNGDVQLRLIQGALYYSDKQFEKAIGVGNEILAIDNKNTDALELISLCNHAMGNNLAYQETAKKILEIDPYNASANIQKAEDLVLGKKYKLARDAYKKALHNEPENEDALFGYAQTSYFVGDMPTATTTLEKMLTLDPENSQAYSYLGKIAAEEENWHKAADYAKKAVLINPDNYDYLLDFGNYNRYLGKYDDAIKSWERAISVEPEYFLAYAYLAGIYDEQNQFDKALENYRKVIETNPDYYYAYEETAILEYHAGNYENAIKYFEKSFEYNQSYAYKLMSYACYAKLGNTFKGKEMLNQYLKKMKKDTNEYAVVRFFVDNYSKNGESIVVQKVNKEENSNNRGKMLFYLGLYNELRGSDVISAEYYAKVTEMKAPMFFEYRIAEWGLNK